MRPGENILEDFPKYMLEGYVGLTIVSKYDEDYLGSYRILHNFKDSNYDNHLEGHAHIGGFCKKRIESTDPEVDMELYKPDDLGEFYRGFTHWDLTNS
jgi:hypothetical protein